MSYTAIIISIAIAAFGIMLGCARGVYISASSCDVKYIYNKFMPKIDDYAYKIKEMLAAYPDELRSYSDAYKTLCRYKSNDFDSLSERKVLFTYSVSRAFGPFASKYWFIGCEEETKTKHNVLHILTQLLINTVAAFFLAIGISRFFKTSDTVLICSVALVSFTLSDMLLTLINRLSELFAKNRSRSLEYCFNEMIRYPAIIPLPIKRSDADIIAEVQLSNTRMLDLSHALAKYSEYSKTLHKRAVALTVLYVISIILTVIAADLVRILI